MILSDIEFLARFKAQASQLAAEIRAAVDGDMIVGFVNETDEEFADTLKNLKEIEFSAMHIFPYSERSGTVASKIGKPVEKCIVKKREAELIKLNQTFKNKFIEQNLNTSHTMLIEEIQDGVALGYTENYIYTYLNGEYEVGSIVEVELIEKHQVGMKACSK